MSEPAQLRAVSIHLPEDVAERLDREPDPGAWVADVLRARLRAEHVTAMLADHGMLPTPEGTARATARRLAAGQPSATYPAIRERVRRELEAQRQADHRAGQAPAA